jgi:hypothetical protein
MKLVTRMSSLFEVYNFHKTNYVRRSIYVCIDSRFKNYQNLKIKRNNIIIPSTNLLTKQIRVCKEQIYYI